MFKGYYYDDETKYYFLNSRYYDPYIHRFISPDSIDYLDPQSLNGLNLYAYGINDPVGITCNNIDIPKENTNSIFLNKSTNNIELTELSSNIKLSKMPWLVDNCTLIYDSASSLITGLPILYFYAKYGKIIRDEFKIYGISTIQTSLKLANVKAKLTKSDWILAGIDVCLDMYDSIRRGVSFTGVWKGAALTLAKDISMLALNKGVMWVTTTIGTAIFPGLGTCIGFTIGLILNIGINYHLGSLLDSLIDQKVE